MPVRRTRDFLGIPEGRLTRKANEIREDRAKGIFAPNLRKDLMEEDDPELDKLVRMMEERREQQERWRAERARME